MNALDLLAQQHRETEEAFRRYEALGQGHDDHKRDIARKVIAELSVHAGIEEMAFYPAVREALPDLDAEIAEDLEEHQAVKEILSEIDGMDPADPRFDTLFRTLITDVRHHVEEEENELFPRVAESVRAEDLQELGDSMETLANNAPTRPHPTDPNEPPWNVALTPVAAVIDRIRDAVRNQVRDRRV